MYICVIFEIMAYIYTYTIHIYTHRDICIYGKPLITQDQSAETLIGKNYVFLLYFQ